MNTFDAAYWSNRFGKGDTPWDIGQVSRPLKEYFDQLNDKKISILIPGCGNGYEAAYLLENGFTNITVIDISPILTAALAVKFSNYTGTRLKIVTGDFFELGGSFDLVVEQTFFCALHPSLRKQYVLQMHRLLSEHGKLSGVLFNKAFDNAGPPFGGTLPLYQELFAPLFYIKTLAPCYNSIAPRDGTECFIIAGKKVLVKA
ncbi:MAG: methyltransferase domain-containing protein [Chitinophagaceae bacterium]